MYEPCKHYKTFNVAGFQRYDGALVLDQMKPGAPLVMMPERDNPYDPEAIALFFEGTMIGYVPREDNSLMSLMMFYGHAGVFEAHVVQVDPEAKPWEQVRVGVYVTDKR